MIIIRNPHKHFKMRPDWRVGLTPAMVCGLGVYILTRTYFNAGGYEILDDISANMKRF